MGETRRKSIMTSGEWVRMVHARRPGALWRGLLHESPKLGFDTEPSFDTCLRPALCHPFVGVAGLIDVREGPARV